MGPLGIILVVIAGIVLLGLIVVLFNFFGLWFQALLSNAKVSLADLIGMRFRKVDARTIVLSRIRAERGQVLGRRRLGRVGALAVGDEYAVTSLPGRMDHRLGQGGKQRIAEVGHDQPDRPGLACLHRLGAGIGPIPQRLGRIANTPAGFLPDRATIVQGIGGRGDRNPGQTRDILQG
jgi:hypothetical protein